MKKVLCLIMVFALCFATVGYASEATPTDMKTVKKNNKKATPTDVSEDIDSASIFGKTVNGNYENEFLGLGFKLKDWHLYSEQELAAVNQVSNDLISSNLIKLALPPRTKLMLLPLITTPKGQSAYRYGITMNIRTQPGGKIKRFRLVCSRTCPSSPTC